MEVVISYVTLNLLIVLLALIVLISSLATKITNKTMHMVYFSSSILLTGLSIIVTILLSNVIGDIGLIDKLLVFGPIFIVIMLVLLPIRKYINSI